MRIGNAAVTLLVTLSFLLPLAAFAAVSPAEFNKAVSIYLREDYEGALSKFQAMVKADPNNAQVHYYVALCNIRTGNRDAGATEYQWILKNSKDEALKEIVTARLLRLRPDLASQLKVKDAQVDAKPGPVKKVIFFSTTWCPTCKEFEKTWDKARVKLGSKVKFAHLNAEDAANWKEVELYRPKAYPTLVYLDEKNHVIENNAGAPVGQQFSNHLLSLGAK